MPRTVRVLGSLVALSFASALTFAMPACGSRVGGNELSPGAGAPGSPDTVAPGDTTTAPAETPVPAVTGLPCDVDKVLKERCQACHGSPLQYGASDRLMTYEDLQVDKSGKKLYERVAERIHQDQNPMPPGPNPRLTADELKAIDTWIAAGTPRSTETCGAGVGPTNLGPQDLGCTPDVTIKSAKPYTMPKISDLYVCVGVELDAAQKRHITAMGPHIDNSKILHHVLLMQASEPVSTTPYVCAGFGSQSWKLVAGWAPGADNFILPPEAGFPYDNSTHFVLQLHYNNAKGLEGEVDNSGFDLCTTDKLRKNDAGVIAFGSMAFSIPPRSKTTQSCSIPVPPVLTSGVKLIRSWPHMHNLGVAMKSTVTPLGGTEKVIVDDKTFSFQDQVSYPLDIDVKPGDIVKTACTWNNTTDATVTWGENTDQEMCYNFTTYYPAIGGNGATALPWMAGSINPVCSTTSE